MPYIVIQRFFPPHLQVTTDDMTEIDRFKRTYRTPLIFLFSLLANRNWLFDLQSTIPNQPLEIRQKKKVPREDFLQWQGASANLGKFTLLFENVWTYPDPTIRLTTEAGLSLRFKKSGEKIIFTLDDQLIQQVTIHSMIHRKLFSFSQETSLLTPLEISALSYLLLLGTRW